MTILTFGERGVSNCTACTIIEMSNIAQSTPLWSLYALRKAVPSLATSPTQPSGCAKVQSNLVSPIPSAPSRALRPLFNKYGLGTRRWPRRNLQAISFAQDLDALKQITGELADHFRFRMIRFVENFVCD